jgi:hypothetical protein
VGAGIDVQTGRTTGGVLDNRKIARHPDTQVSLVNLPIPFWTSLLRISMDVADALQMGYIGVDLVIDNSRGPLVLEANARPGLAIQIANREGLLPRLRFVDEHREKTVGRAFFMARAAYPLP